MTSPFQNDPDLIQYRNITFVPVIHGRLEFGVIARRLFYQLRPDAVAVEFPNTIHSQIIAGLERLPFISVVLYQEKDGRHVYLPLEPQDACVAAAHLAHTNSVHLSLIDRDTEGYPRLPQALPDPYTVVRLGLRTYVEAYEKEFGQDEPLTTDHLREMTMAYHLQKLSAEHERVLCVIGLSHYPGVRKLLDRPLALPIGRTKRDHVSLANLAKESSREILSEMPYIAAEFSRAGESDSPPPLDRLQLHQDLLAQAREKHQKNSKDDVSPAQMAVLNKFARNYALIQNHLTPDLYQLLIAARGAVDDNFAYEVWDLASEYPWQDQVSNLPNLRLRGEDLFLDSRKIRFYRRFRHFRRRLVKVPVKQRKREKTPGQWKKEWQGQFICSYPPEDIVIEGFGDYLKKKTLQILSEENRRTQPFTASMLDGIDIRETIRNWHAGKLYVSESLQVRGKVGSVVVIFDYDIVPPDEPEQYPWKLSWLGEHEQESDMAFYSTHSGENVVGPGVSKCEYGGFMLTYPPLRLYDIWKDSFFDRARTKAERLLLAGVDYSEEKLIAYIAPKPPPDRVKSMANLYGKKVVYIPLGQFSPVTLKKMRTFHVLDGHHVRGWAGEYIY